METVGCAYKRKLMLRALLVHIARLMSKVLMRSKVRRGTCLVWRLLAAAAVAAAIQALSVGYVILLALKIEGAFEFVLYTDSQYAELFD